MKRFIIRLVLEFVVIAATAIAAALLVKNEHPVMGLWILSAYGMFNLWRLGIEKINTEYTTNMAAARQRLERPAPRVALGLALRGVARSAIDLSDGLAGDLPHVLQASSQAAGQPLGAELDEQALIGLTAPWAQEAQEEQEAQPACGKSALDAAARLQAALDGTWQSQRLWGGVKDGMVSVGHFGPRVPEAVQKQVLARQADMAAGRLHPFAGPLRDNTGREVLPAGQTLTDQQIMEMNWLAEGVQGTLPR